MAAYFCTWLVFLAFLPSGELQGFYENSTAWTQGSGVSLLRNTISCLKGETPMDVSTLLFPRMQPLSLSFHTAWNYLVFSDTGLNTIVVYQPNSSRAVYAHVGTSPKVGHVSVDWISNNIYWADAGFGWIGLQSLKSDMTKFATNGRLKVIVSTLLEDPYGLVVAPYYRRVFWSDVGSPPKIESSDLLGHDRKALVWQGLATPTALSVDQSSQRLFWTDQSKHTIESCDFYGGARRVLYFSEDSQFGGLQVFAEYVLFTEQKTNSLNGLDRNTGKQAVSSLSLPSDPSSPPGSLAVFSTAFQQRGNNISCSQMACCHICIQQEQGGVCICTSGSTLKSDGKTCQESPVPLWKSFIVSSGTKVCAVPVNLLYSFPNLPPAYYNIKCFLNESNIQHLAVNSYNATLYYVTGSSWIRTHDIRSGRTDNITTVVDSVGGLTYDEVRGSLIWSETLAGRIMALDLHRGDNATQLYSSLNSPGDLTVTSLRGQLFWVEGLNPHYTLVRGDVVPPFNKSILVNSGLTRPHSLVYDDKQNRLYWLDVDYLGSVRGDGSDKSVFSLSSITTYRGLALFKSNLVWLTRSPDSNLTFRSSDLRDSSVQTTFNLPGLTDLTDLVFYDADAEMPDSVSCGRNNGGCDQVCVVDSNIPRCACRFGFHLQDDGITCTASFVNASFFLTTEPIQSTVYQIRTDGNVSALPASRGSRPACAIFNQLTNDVIWFDSATSAIKRSALNGNFTEKVLLQLSQSTNKVTSMRIDYSTGNLYFAETTENENNGWIKVLSLKNGALHTLLSNVTVRYLDIAPGQGYLVYGSTAGSIYQSDMAAQEPQKLLKRGLVGLSGLTFTTSGTSVVWSDWVKDEIVELPLDTHIDKIRLQKAGSFPYSLVTWDDNLYYLSKKSLSINLLTPTNQESEVHKSPQFGMLTSLTFQGTRPTSASTACSDHNGRCSTLCIPVPNGFRKCACSDGVELQDDMKTCKNVERCSDAILNGYLDSSCDRYPGYVCDYSCRAGYIKSVHTSILCLNTGSWNVSTNNLCPQPCPTRFPNGGVEPNSCQPAPGQSCIGTCDLGYQSASGTSFTIKCGANSQWTPDVNSICYQPCATQFENGDVDASCRPEPGQSCLVICNLGYQSAKGKNLTATCGANGQWTPAIESLCLYPDPGPGQGQGQGFPGYAIGVVSAGGVAIVALVVGCILFSRMKRFRGHNPKDSISGFIKKNVLSRKSSRDSTATLRYTTNPAVRTHDADSLYDEIPDHIVFSQFNNGFLPDSLDSSFSPHVTSGERASKDDYLTLIDDAVLIDGKTPQPCPRTSLKQSANNGYLTASVLEETPQTCRHSSSNQPADNGYLRVSLNGENPQPCQRSSLKQQAATGYLNPGSANTDRVVCTTSNPAPDYD